MDKIFVQIASYRDEEISKTIKSCLEKASYPDRITFGIVHQYDQKTQSLLNEYKDNKQFRIYGMIWQEAKGAGLARSICNSLYQNERFTLQIDSHTRFGQNWDENLIEQWKLCGDSRAVLSVLPHSYYYQDGTEVVPNVPTVEVVSVLSKFFYKNIPTINAIIVEKIGQNKPRPSYFVVGGFIFTIGRVCLEVPYSSGVAFIGEEIIHSLRLFTHGYNMYTPSRLDLYHLYERPRARRYWDDMKKHDKLSKQIYDKNTSSSYELVSQTLSGKDKSLLGTQRSLKDFEYYVGVDFTDKLVHPSHKLAKLPPVALDDSWKTTLLPNKKYSILIDIELPKIDFKIVRLSVYDEYEVEVYVKNIEYQNNKSSYKIEFSSKTRPTTYRLRPLGIDGKWQDLSPATRIS